MVYVWFNHITTPYWDVDVEFQIFSKVSILQFTDYEMRLQHV